MRALLDGGTGMALWIPLADAPQAEPLRVWLHKLCNRAHELHSDLVSILTNTHYDGRVHLHVTSNASGHYSVVPYSLRAQRMTVCTPIRWPELGSFAGGDAFRYGAIPARMQTAGDVFATEVKIIAEQAFGRLSEMDL